MRLGVSLPNNQGVPDIRGVVECAATAERLGYQSAWVSEHLFHASYVARRLEDRPYHDPLTVLAAAAMVTSRIRLGTSVLVLPWHHPVRLAKTVAAVDGLSGGRVDVGVGVGVTEDEYANLGVRYADRGPHADEVLAAMIALWTQDVPEFAGDRFRFARLRFEPKCVQRPHVPIWVGGNSQAAFRRAARFGHGWHGLSLSPVEVQAAAAGLERACREEGRDADGLPMSLRVVLQIKDESWTVPVAERRTLKGTPDELRQMLACYRDAGLEELVVDPATADLVAYAETLDRLRTEVWPLEAGMQV